MIVIPTTIEVLTPILSPVEDSTVHPRATIHLHACTYCVHASGLYTMLCRSLDSYANSQMLN